MLAPLGVLGELDRPAKAFLRVGMTMMHCSGLGRCERRLRRAWLLREQELRRTSGPRIGRWQMCEASLAFSDLQPLNGKSHARGPRPL